MFILFFLASSFPALALNFGMGNIPSRYLALGVIPRINRLTKIDFIFPVLIFIHAFYVVAVIMVRPLHLLDISFLIGYMYVFLGLQFVRNNLCGFKRFVYYFWLANILFATYQNIILIAGIDQKYALFHQNVHKEDYVIPVVNLMPELFRVTGLFVESAPFVLYLIFTHFAFSVMGFSRNIRSVNLSFILLAGAKVGYLFILILLMNSIFARIKTNILLPLLSGIVVTVAITPVILEFVAEYPGLYSIYLRLAPLYNLMAVFSENPFGMFFGYGLVSSTELMAGEFEGAQRGIDFFSTYVVANGILGSSILLLPLYFWFKRHIVNLSLKERNLLTISLVLALLSMGSLLNFQYAYLLFIVAYTARLRNSVSVVYEVKDRASGE